MNIKAPVAQAAKGSMPRKRIRKRSADRPPTGRERLTRLVRYGTGFISLVLVALFVQKSDGNSSIETLLWLGIGTAGAFLISTGLAGLYLHPIKVGRFTWYFAREWTLFLSITLGGSLLIGSLAVIDAEDSDYPQPPTNGQAASDTKGYVLRDLFAATNDSTTRIVVQVINTSKSPVILNRAEVAVMTGKKGACDTGGSLQYQFTDTVTVEEGGTLKDAKVDATSGPLTGFAVPASGSLHFYCMGSSLVFDFATTINLDPLETRSLTIDIPTVIHARSIDSKKPDPGQTQALSAEETKSTNHEFSVPPTEKDAWAHLKLELWYNGVAGRACAQESFNAPPGLTADPVLNCG